MKKEESGKLTLADIADAAEKAAVDSKLDLENAVKSL